MLRDPQTESMSICMRGVLRQNPDLWWKLLTEHKTTALDLRKAALDPTDHEHASMYEEWFQADLFTRPKAIASTSVLLFGTIKRYQFNVIYI
jgi:hypothetical protein